MEVGKNGRSRASAANTATHPTPLPLPITHNLYSISTSCISHSPPASTNSVDSDSVVPTGLSEDCANADSNSCAADSFAAAIAFSSSVVSASDVIGRYSSNFNSLLALSTCLTSLRCALIVEAITSSIASYSSTGIVL